MLHARGAREKLIFPLRGMIGPRFSAPRHTAEPSWTLFLASRGIFGKSMGTLRALPGRVWQVVSSTQGGSGFSRAVPGGSREPFWDNFGCPGYLPGTIFGRFRYQFWLPRASRLATARFPQKALQQDCHNKVSTEGFVTARLPQQGFHRRLFHSRLVTTKFPQKALLQ